MSAHSECSCSLSIITVAAAVVVIVFLPSLLLLFRQKHNEKTPEC